MSPRSKEELRDDSFSARWRRSYAKTEHGSPAFNPAAGRMEDRTHFANFLNAILAGDPKAIDFLKKMPPARKAQLKALYANSGFSVQVLDSF